LKTRRPLRALFTAATEGQGDLKRKLERRFAVEHEFTSPKEQGQSDCVVSRVKNSSIQTLLRFFKAGNPSKAAQVRKKGCGFLQLLDTDPRHSLSFQKQSSLAANFVHLTSSSIQELLRIAGKNRTASSTSRHPRKRAAMPRSFIKTRTALPLGKGFAKPLIFLPSEAPPCKSRCTFTSRQPHTTTSRTAGIPTKCCDPNYSPLIHVVALLLDNEVPPLPNCHGLGGNHEIQGDLRFKGGPFVVPHKSAGLSCVNAHNLDMITQTLRLPLAVKSKQERDSFGRTEIRKTMRLKGVTGKQELLALRHTAAHPRRKLINAP
jgi:hypothetical protein